jgi:programmed cell death protein 5
MDELEQLRAKRIMEMQQQQQQQKPQGAASKEDEQRAFLLSQILTNEARTRLNTISVVKKERAMQIEDSLIRMAKMGQIRGRVSEEQLVKMLSDSDASTKEVKVRVARRRDFDEDSDDEDYGF